MSRRKKPAPLHLVDGTHQSNRHPPKDQIRDEMRKSRSAGPMRAPTWLSKVAKREWRRVEPLLRDKGLTELGDLAALAAYCRAYAELQAHQATIEQEGRFYTSDKGNFIQHPAVGAANKLADQLRMFSIEFGFTPSSRGRMGVTPGAKRGAVAAFAATRDGAKSG